MTWSSLNKKRKRARPTYEFIPRNGVRCIRIRTYLSMLYGQRTLQPCTTKLKNCNTHFRRISLPPTKRRATRQLDCFPLALKILSGALPNARSLRVYLKERDTPESDEVTTGT
jgi:hypothetical protein